MNPIAAASPREPGALFGVVALVVGGLWVAGATAAAFALLGASWIFAATPVELGALAGAILLPALMAWFSGLAARESARARAEARRLADAADRLMNPERSAEEAARQLALTVRGEIGALDKAIDATLGRLQEVEGQIARQAYAVDQMADQAKAGANQMIFGMEREREELLRISQDLTKHAQTIGSSISQHTKAISEAARQAEAEVRAADQALDHRLTSFGAAAALISDRTNNLSSAAQASADSAVRLEQALSGALEVLAKATNLTDSARQSAEAATLAANSTAGAVRETTDRAIDDAKRAADLIRGEAVSVEREAAAAMERLRDAAEAARAAAIDARNAVETDAQIQRRARPRVAEPPPPEAPHHDASWRSARDPLDAAPPPARIRREEPPYRGHDERPAAGDWTWKDLLSSVNGQQPASQPSARRAVEDPVAHLRRQIVEPRGGEPTLPIVEIIERAGLRLDGVFSPSGLERIAQRARSGSQARRRAVHDAAPDSVRLLADHFAQDPEANLEAMQFLRGEGARVSELIGRGRAAMNAEATQAFLLIDAAAS